MLLLSFPPKRYMFTRIRSPRLAALEILVEVAAANAPHPRRNKPRRLGYIVLLASFSKSSSNFASNTCGFEYKAYS